MQFLELSDSLQKHLSNGAAQMSGVLLHAVDQLIRDKRGAKTVRRVGGGGGGVRGREGGRGGEGRGGEGREGGRVGGWVGGWGVGRSMEEGGRGM